MDFQTSRLFIRGSQMSDSVKNFIGLFTLFSDGSTLHLTRNNFKEHYTLDFITDFIVFIHWRFIYYGGGVGFSYCWLNLEE